MEELRKAAEEKEAAKKAEEEQARIAAEEEQVRPRRAHVQGRALFANNKAQGTRMIQDTSCAPASQKGISLGRGGIVGTRPRHSYRGHTDTGHEAIAGRLFDLWALCSDGSLTLLLLRVLLPPLPLLLLVL